MYLHFLISSIQVITQLNPINKGNLYFYTNHANQIKLKDKLYSFFIDGYILPRTSINLKYNSLSSIQLVETLFNIYDVNFIHYIKGQFIILIVDNNSFHLFTNRSGIRKVFIYKNGHDFVITNDIRLLKPIICLEPDIEGIINYHIFNNCINGKTLFKNIYYSAPAAHISFDKELSEKTWFSPASLLNIQSRKMSYSDIAENMYELTKSLIKHNLNENTCLTLTGGLDSRLALSLIIKNGIIPNALIYGNAESKDAIFSSLIAESCKLPFKIYDLAGESSLYGKWVDEIIEIGNGMISLHRAHRLFAYKCFANEFWANGLLCTGHMGGELIRNFCFEGTIINPLMEYFIKNHELNKRKLFIKSYVPCLFLNNTKDYFCNALLDYLESLPFLSSIQKTNEFNVTFNYLINIHHAQDILLADKFFNYVYPIFLDDEVIEFIFQTGNTFYHNYQKEHNISNSIRSHKLYCELINILSPELSGLPFGKRGYFTVNEHLHNSSKILYMKRALRYLTEKRKYPPNFSYGTWFNTYIEAAFNSMARNPALQELFSSKEIGKQLKEGHQKQQKFTGGNFQIWFFLIRY